MNVHKISKKAYANAIGVMTSASVVICTVMPVIAADNTGTAQMKGFVEDFMKPWLELIGGIIAMIGGVMFALGWQREDAEGKSKGLMTCMAGFMIVGVAMASSIFITN